MTITHNLLHPEIRVAEKIVNGLNRVPDVKASYNVLQSQNVSNLLPLQTCVLTIEVTGTLTNSELFALGTLVGTLEKY
jgi:hypothetical protein